MPVLLIATSAAGAVLAGARPADQVNGERTLVGCVERADPSPADLLLTHAGDLRDGQRSGAAAKNDAIYRLSYGDDLKLGALVGHRVRIVGRVEKEAPRTGRPLPADPTDERVAGQSTEKRGDAPTFRVRTVRSVAVRCNR